MNFKDSATAMRAMPSGRRVWMPVAVWGLVAAALTMVYVCWPEGSITGLSYYALTAGAGLVAWVCLLRHDRSARRGLALLAAGVAANGIADLLWWLIAETRGEPDVSVADAFYLASYVLVIVAVVGRRPEGSRWRRPDADGLIDLVTFTTIALVLVDHVADFGALLDDNSVSVGVRLVWAAYPVLDALLMVTLLEAMTSGRLRGRAGAVLVTGAGFWLIADVGYLVEDGSFTKWLDAGWMLGAAAMAAAIALPADRHGTLDRPEQRVGTLRIAVNFVPLLIPAALDLHTHFAGDGEAGLQLWVAMGVLVVCAYVRAQRLLRARDEHEAMLVEREHYHRVLANNSFDAVVVIDGEGRTAAGSPQLAKMLGRPELGELGCNLVSALPEQERLRVLRELDQLWANPGERAETDLEIAGSDGVARWFHVRTVNLRDDPAIGGVVLNMYEVTERKRAERELAHQAFHDALTGLPNRALFHERVEHTLRAAARSGRGVAVIYLDVDGFKSANDRFGHQAGDAVLQQVADRLTGALRDTDTVARLGGDEFAILIECAHHPVDEATTAAERVLQALSQPFRLGDQELPLGASIGVTIAGRGATAETLLRDADIAMYQSKAGGKNRWTLYEADMRAAAIEQSELRADLEHAIELGQFRLEYQPVVRLDTETIVGFEALARWDHPTRGAISPATFIPIAESSGAILKIGQWALEEACRTAARWQHEFEVMRPTMSVNLSARQIADPAIVHRVAGALERSGLDPEKLVLEMTESVLVEDPEVAAVRLAELRALGARLAIDDFGTGYSSLSYLRQFPVDIIKIDRSFINSITDRSQVPAIIRGLLDLGRTLELATVAEGIEIDAQLASLRDEHCDFGQGFLFAQPLTREGAEALVAQLALNALPVA